MLLDVLVTAVNAVFPIVLLILLGYFLKRLGFLSKEFLKVGNKLVFNVCLPCMLFMNIYDGMDSFADINWPVVLYSMIAVLVIFGLGLLTAVLTTKRSNRRGVILQCTFRSNFAIIGLSLVERLGGDTVVADIVSAFSIPLFNVLAVIALTVFAEKEQPAPQDIFGSEVAPALARKRAGFGVQLKKILLGIVKNPLIIGVFVGLVFVGIREIERALCGGQIPFRFDREFEFLYVGTGWLKAIASPLALIVLGGQFEFSAVKGMTREIVVGTVWRIVLAPLIGIGVAVLFSTFCPQVLYIAPGAYPTLIALFGSPVAVSSAIMAGQMGGDEQLATQLVVWTSIGSILTVFITVCILAGCGLLV